LVQNLKSPTRRNQADRNFSKDSKLLALLNPGIGDLLLFPTALLYAFFGSIISQAQKRK
jgi:hypothetical protein